MSKSVKPVEKANAGWCSVRLECFKELGWALFYLSYLHAEPANEKQLQRVDRLCREAVANDPVASLDYWKHFLKRIEDETENLC